MKTPYQLTALQAYIAEMSEMRKDLDTLVAGYELADKQGFDLMVAGITKALSRATDFVTDEISAHYSASVVEFRYEAKLTGEMQATLAEVIERVKSGNTRYSEIHLSETTSLVTCSSQDELDTLLDAVTYCSRIAGEVGNADRRERLDALYEQLSSPSDLEVVNAPQPSVEATECDTVDAPTNLATPEIDMSIFSGFKWWSDEDHNGRVEDIFKFVLQVDPNTCDMETFIKGLLYARVERNGKDASLKMDEIMELCALRNFAGWPVTKHGVTVKTKAKAIIKPVIDQLKETHSFDKKTLKEITKSGYPTHAHYRQDFLDKCVYEFEGPDLDGDDLDAMCDNIEADQVELKSDYEAEVEEPVKEEPKPVNVTNTTLRAMEILGLK